MDKIENILLELTKTQAKHLDTLMWLNDPIGHRGTGRTKVIAVSYILLAIKYIGMPIKIQDHTPHPQYHKMLLGIISGILNNLDKEWKKNFKYEISLYNSTLTINYAMLDAYKQKGEGL